MFSLEKHVIFIASAVFCLIGNANSEQINDRKRMLRRGNNLMTRNDKTKPQRFEEDIKGKEFLQELLASKKIKTPPLICPSDVINEVVCPSSYEPVVCQVNGQECQYQNLCSADITIGVEASNCVLAEKKEIQGAKVLQKLLYLRKSRMITSANDCPTDMEDGAMCSMVYDPVICQVNGQECQYSNSCFANGTIGVDGSNCTTASKVQPVNLTLSSPNKENHVIDACRIVMPLPGTPPCTTPGNVVCGTHDCVYSDICEANLSGYDQSECLTLVPFIDGKISVANNFQCPSTMEEDVYCTMHIDPVVCQVEGNNCEYSNSCIAGATVGVSATSCSPKQTSPTATVKNNFQCPSTMEEDVYCTMHIDPVVCQVEGNNCEYSNSCIAGATVGVNATSCSPKQTSPTSTVTNNFQCPSTMEEDVYCTMHIDPVVCQVEGNNCEYSNSCIAGATVGVDSTACVDKNTDSSSSTPGAGALNLKKACPDNAVPPNAPICAQSGNVVCGTLMCRYDDLCVAKYNGFNDAECSSETAMKKAPSNDLASFFGN